MTPLDDPATRAVLSDATAKFDHGMGKTIPQPERLKAYEAVLAYHRREGKREGLEEAYQVLRDANRHAACDIVRERIEGNR